MFHAIAYAVCITFDALRVLVPMLILGRLLYAVARFLLLPAAAKRNYPAALWSRFRWRHLVTNLGLAYLDEHRKTVKPVPFGTSVSMRYATAGRSRLRFPRASIRPDAYGLVASVKTVPKVGAAEFEAASSWICDSWKCCRVGITQPKPGRLIVRGLIRDPLAEPLAVTDLPAFDGRHVFLGRDEWGKLRAADWANHAGSVWAGNPGRGKTEAALSLAVQLVPSPLVDLWLMDGGACDWAHFADGAAGYVDDDLEAAVNMLLELDGKMRARRRSLEADLGVRNAWRVGPTEAYRLQWLMVEEAPFYLSLDAVKGDKKREGHVVACRGLIAQLLRRGRAPMFHTSLVGQKVTSSSIPPDLRDLCGLRWSFGCSTIESAEAVLGADIRQHDTMQPTLLQAPEHVGVATALLRTAGSPYTMVKFPAVGEELADRVAAQAAQRRAIPAPSDKAKTPVTA